MENPRASGHRRVPHPAARLLGILMAIGTTAAVAAAGCSAERDAELQQLTKQTLAFYQRHFTDTQFVNLPKDGDTVGAMVALELLLGYQPTALDYECPPDLAETLRLVSVERIARMMQYKLPCATLFQHGEQALAKRPKVCVITLSACDIAGNDRQATAFLADLPTPWTSQLRDEHLLDADAQLRYILDHEAYHCLDSSLHGGMPRGYEDYWGEYWRTRNEMAADAFAVAMHIRRNGKADAFVTNLARLRGLALYGGDPQHFSYDAIQQVARMAPEKLTAMTPREVVQLAHRIGVEQMPDYPTFLRFWAAAHRVMAEMKVEAASEGNQAATPQAMAQADPKLVEEMTSLSRRLHHELLGDRPATP